MTDSEPHAEAAGRRKPWRLLVLIATGVLLVAAVTAYRHWWLARPVGEGPAGPSVADEFVFPPAAAA